MSDVRVRAVPELLVVTEQRNVDHAELKIWLPTAMRRIAHLAARVGGIATAAELPFLEHDSAEPVFIVIFDGDPGDVAVPVEVCAPVHHESSAIAMRRDPAHREAYLRNPRRARLHPTDHEIVDSARAIYCDHDVLDFAWPIR